MPRLVQPGVTRAPRVRLLADGQPMPGLINAIVTSNSHLQADKFSLELALNVQNGQPLQWWASEDRKQTVFDVRISLDGDERSLIVGHPDLIEITPEQGLVSLDGRDLAARLIDATVQSTYQNRTSSEIATDLAKAQGLTPVVTATTTPVSRYYGDTHDRVQHKSFSKSGTQWDLLGQLAQIEGFDLFVSGYELHFQPGADPDAVQPYTVRWNADTNVSDAIRLRLTNNPSVATGKTAIEVKSWSSMHGRGFTKISPAGTSTKDDSVRVLSYTRANLSEDQAQKLADYIYTDITKHTRAISFDCPGELALTPRDVIALHGTEGFDQTYFVDTITRRLSFENGFTESITAKNGNAETAKAGSGKGHKSFAKAIKGH